MELSNLSVFFSFPFLETNLVVFRSWNRSIGATRLRGSFSIWRFTIFDLRSKLNRKRKRERERKKEIIFASDDTHCEATKTLASGAWLYQIFISTFRNDRKGKGTKRRNPIGGGGSIARYNVRSSSFTRFYYSANRFVSRTYRFQLSPPDRRNSTINFASRKRERFSFHFDRPRSAADLSLFPLSPPRSLSLSSAKIYSLLSPIARRFRFPSRSSKGKNLFLPLDRVSRIDPLIFLAVQRRKEKNKRSRVGRISRFVRIFLILGALFIPFPREILIIFHRSRNGWRGVQRGHVIRHRCNSAQGTSRPVEKCGFKSTREV